MKTKLVKETLNSFLFEDMEEENGVEEMNFTPEQKNAIEQFIMNYEGDFEDDEIHDFAEELGLNVHEVEEYIYNMARTGEREEEMEGDKDPAGENSAKKGFHIDIESETISNKDFRRILYTGENLQLVLMTLKPGEDIGMEVHPDIDQFFRFDEGKGKAIINGNEYPLKDGDAIIIPAGAEHNIIADPKVALKMYTVYAPPNHDDGVVHVTKEDAEADKETFTGKTTE